MNGIGIRAAAAGLLLLASATLSLAVDPSTRPAADDPPGREPIIVCRDAGAGGYEAFPDVCRLSDGRLMCVFYAGYDHVSRPNHDHPLGGRIAFCTSRDEGRTWSEPRTLYDGDGDDRDPSMTQLSDGRLLCTFFTLEWTSPEPRYTCRGTRLLTSDDLGRTWSEPALIAKDYFCSSPVRELRDGSLILGIYAQRNEGQWGAVTRSTNDGRSWSPPVDIPNAGMPLPAETDVIELRDGRLFAALRGAGNTAAWSVSDNHGESWSTAEPFGFPGHCPYLHRTVDGAVLMAQRLPNTTLRFSRDDCRTWSPPVEVDSFSGAYPSMATLRDGTILIVYYEEGAGSNIRARRFRLRGSAVDWLPPADEHLARCGVWLQQVTRIADTAPYNSFTDLVRYDGKFFCVFRESTIHRVAPSSSIRILSSADDGQTWTSSALISASDEDLRDPKITVTPDHRLMLYAAAARAEPVDGVTHRNYAWFSRDGREWTDRAEIGEPNMWMWRITWHKAIAYGIGYSLAADHAVRLYRSTDGLKFETIVPHMGNAGEGNETSTILFDKDDTAAVLLRRDPDAALLGTARPPYRQWSWKELSRGVGGPQMVRLPDGRLLAAVRLRGDDLVRTGLTWIDPDAGTITEFIKLPSGGDTSYAGMVLEGERLFISYYASHEGKTAVYFARLKLDNGN